MLKRFLYCVLIVAGIVGCQDEEFFLPDPRPATFDASAFVTVIDPDGQPVKDAKIELGNRVGYTNEDGVILFKDVDMTEATYARVEKSGYFHGSRRFYPTRDRLQYVEIMLTPLIDVGSFSATAGGHIVIDDKASLHFPASAIVDGQGHSYGGEVLVKAYPIHADDPNLSIRMPGDLVGINEAGTIGALASLGMIAVELFSDTGERLQVGNEKTVEMRMQIPASQLTSAPSVIPMWYFDESAGVWKQEGEATKEGNTYVAQLPHFSYWNCDAWFPLVKWGATFVYENGEPASQLQVCLTILSLQTTRCGQTDDEGLTCGEVAANEEMLMEVMDPCGNVIYSQNIGPYSDNTMIGPITLPANTTSTVDISGSAIDCNLDPVTNGYVRVQTSGRAYLIQLDENDGSFNTTLLNCQQDDIDVKVVDVAALKESQTSTYPYASTINTGAINVCDVLSEYIDIEVLGFQDHFLFFFPNMYNQGSYTTISAQDSLSFNFFYLYFEGTAPGTYVSQGVEIGIQLGALQVYAQQDANIVITNYGGVGEYITGTVSGTLVEGQGVNTYPFTGNFSVLRE